MRWAPLCLLLAACAQPVYAPPPLACQEQQPSCQAKFQSGHTIYFQWEKMPTEEETGSFIISIFRPNLSDVSPVLEDYDPLEIVLWMPSMGHGSSPVVVEKIGLGTYRASEVFFTMRGEWEIRAQKKNGTEIIDQAILPLRF